MARSSRATSGGRPISFWGLNWWQQGNETRVVGGFPSRPRTTSTAAPPTNWLCACTQSSTSSAQSPPAAAAPSPPGPFSAHHSSKVPRYPRSRRTPPGSKPTQAGRSAGSIEMARHWRVLQFVTGHNGEQMRVRVSARGGVGRT